jgi:hypothetical protein
MQHIDRVGDVQALAAVGSAEPKLTLGLPLEPTALLVDRGKQPLLGLGRRHASKRTDLGV